MCYTAPEVTSSAAVSPSMGVAVPKPTAQTLEPGSPINHGPAPASPPPPAAGSGSGDVADLLVFGLQNRHLLRARPHHLSQKGQRHRQSLDSKPDQLKMKVNAVAGFVVNILPRHRTRHLRLLANKMLKNCTTNSKWVQAGLTSL